MIANVVMKILLVHHHHQLHSHHHPIRALLSRSNFMKGTLTTLLTGLMMTSQNHVETAIMLLDSVYGPIQSPNFPFPVPKDEAGLCADGVQRRYLWTDAFAVLCYMSLADTLRKMNQEQERSTQAADAYENAAHRLVHVVHECLGKPRSLSKTDQMTTLNNSESPTGYVGLRIGKVDSRLVTDYGMRYDGQYWHYMDKWLFALARSGHVREGIAIAKAVFPYFFDAGPTGDGRAGGIRWKLSVDATPPPELQRAHVSDDTLVALITFQLLESARTTDMASLRPEIELLQNSLEGYRPRVTDDPLGWGLECIFDQFIHGHPRIKTLRSIHSEALHASHLSLPLRLYGAMIGARVAGESVAPASAVDRLVDLSIKHEVRAMKGREEHSSINRVMLAMCLLCPGALGRRPSDPLIRLY